MFIYVGINLKQQDDFSITVNKHAYNESIQPILVTITRQQISNLHRNVTNKEESPLRSAIGLPISVT